MSAKKKPRNWPDPHLLPDGGHRPVLDRAVCRDGCTVSPLVGRGTVRVDVPNLELSEAELRGLINRCWSAWSRVQGKA